MKINIKFFAALREAAGCRELEWETEANSPKELYSELKDKYNLNLSLDHLKVAVNDNYESMNYEIKDKDTIVFIPPVAGG